MDPTEFGPDCEAIAHVKRLTEGLELENVEVRHPDRKEPTMLPGAEFGRLFEKQSDVIEAVAAKVSGARVTIADVISESDPIVIPFTKK